MHTPRTNIDFTAELDATTTDRAHQVPVHKPHRAGHIEPDARRERHDVHRALHDIERGADADALDG